MRGIFLKKHAGKIYVIILLMISLFASLLYAKEKEGFHLDEILTYKLANSAGGLDGFLYDSQWHTRQDILSYVEVNDETAFNLDVVYINQKNDVHPPMYYILINLFSSIQYNLGFGISKWTGILLNLVFFIISGFIIYNIAATIVGKSKFTVPLVSCALYGCTYFMVANRSFIRMYTMFSFWVLLILLLHVKLLLQNHTRKWKSWIGICVVVVGGVLTQYYFLIYMFFLAGCMVLYFLYQKKIKEMFVYSASVLAGVGISVLLFPPMIEHIFFGYRGKEAFSNASLISFQTVNKVWGILKDINLNVTGTIGSIILVIGAVFFW